MIGVTIGEKHSYNDWGLILSSKIISPPKPKLNQISVPVRDGTIDLTETLTEDIKFEDRMISLTFSVVEKEILGRKRYQILRITYTVSG